MMLFKGATEIDPELWDSIPNDTNASECMHEQFYNACRCGGNHDIVTGFQHIYAFLDTLRWMSLAVQSMYFPFARCEHHLWSVLVGGPICYGAGERWKHLKKETGLTKRQYAMLHGHQNRGKNDSRAPDRVSQLLRKNRKNRSPSKKGSPTKSRSPLKKDADGSGRVRR